MAQKLTLDDIADQRAYEREREAFRDAVIAEKRRRRVAVGPIITLVFENRTTIRFQIQEMARVERMVRDEQVQRELDVYNRLIPDRGELSATLFVELTSREQLERWLPALVGIERSVALRIGDAVVDVVAGVPEPTHAGRPTRDETTASVHYIRFRLTPAQVDRFAGEPVAVVVSHAAYPEATRLEDATKGALLEDLRGV